METSSCKYTRHYKPLLSLGLPIIIGQLGIILVGFARHGNGGALHH